LVINRPRRYTNIEQLLIDEMSNARIAAGYSQHDALEWLAAFARSEAGREAAE
jgi:hypothetical protein